MAASIPPDIPAIAYLDVPASITIMQLPDGEYVVIANAKNRHGSAVGKSFHSAFAKATGRDDYSISTACSTLKNLLALIAAE